MARSKLEALLAAAESGDPTAQCALGYLYDVGDGGVEQDPGRAAFWYEKSAEAGYPRGQFNFAEVLRDGVGVEQCATRAFHWYHEAAKQGFAKAQYNLAMMYATGEGVAQDVRLAYVWLTLALGGDAEGVEEALAIVAGHLKPADVEATADILARLRPCVPGHDQRP